MSEAARQAALTGRTDDELLTAIFAAAALNRASGGAVVAPWDVRDLPDEWIEAGLAATTGMDRWRKFLKEGGIG